MNPKYTDGIEAQLNDIVVVRKIETRQYEDRGYCWTDEVDCGDQLARVVDFHIGNKKCFEIRFLGDEKRTYRISKCHLADYRDALSLY